MVFLLQRIAPSPGSRAQTWSDSDYVVRGFAVRLAGGSVVSLTRDLWGALQAELLRHGRAVDIFKAPAHKDLEAACCCPAVGQFAVVHLGVARARVSELRHGTSHE